VAHSPDHAKEILFRSALILASGNGTLAERLENAFPGHLAQFSCGLPPPWPDIAERVDAVIKRCRPWKAIRDLPVEEQGKLAEELVCLFAEVTRRVASEQHRPLGSPGQPG
jgi:hypothetical protein